ncbi:hypothetical protein [Gilvibacter sediminis]|uniref:hypothetical protein n=1 Tax=Gilvibacter sediminis TaxID=379071 RepID=UPI0023509012|nr:hypothetical protein [Gilvibacter sediminis]MDC7998022.1 hypothetical protein [Gilvibacter sediminis]
MIVGLCYGQNTQKELKPELIGTWQFVALTDAQNNKVDTIFHNIPGVAKAGWEIPKGPLLRYYEDGTYTKEFTPENIDTGKWYYDKENSAIIHLLYYDKPYNEFAQYLIDEGHARKDENGDYYEKITNSVYEITDQTLVLLERGDRRRIFVKKL